MMDFQFGDQTLALKIMLSVSARYDTATNSGKFCLLIDHATTAQRHVLLKPVVESTLAPAVEAGGLRDGDALHLCVVATNDDCAQIWATLERAGEFSGAQKIAEAS